MPDGDFHVGDLQFLPFNDDAFDAVTGFNSFQYAGTSDIELRRVRGVHGPRRLDIFLLDRSPPSQR